VSALHVISEDLQLRLSVDRCLVRKDEVLIELFGVCVNCTLAHEDLAVEDRTAIPIKNAFVELMTGAVRMTMID
jgi:hypothetical protein